MDILGRALRRARYLVFRDAVDADMDEEIRFHVERETERYLAEGLSPKEARRRALVAFGGVERHRADTREARGTSLVESLWSDLRGAVRSARRSPGFTLAVTATLGLAIGANTAIFSVFEAVLLRPMPSPEPHRLATVSMFWPDVWRTPSPIQSFRFDQWRQSQRSFDALAAFTPGPAIISEGGEPQLLEGARVSEDYFRVVGVEPFMGRAFTPEEYRRDGPDVVVVSHDFWTARLGASPGALGTTIPLNGLPYTIVGVMPEDFVWYLNAAAQNPLSLWRPDPLDAPGFFEVLGRLRDGATVEQADAELRSWGPSIWTYDIDDSRPWQEVRVESFQEAAAASRRVPLSILQGAVAFILLIACLNVGHLLLARGESRRASVTLRRALGASRARVTRELFAESLLISLLGGALGVGLAHALMPLLVSVGPPELLRSAEPALNRSVLLFAVGLAATTTMLTGLAPALRAARHDLAAELRRSSDGRTNGSTHRWAPQGLVVAEVAVATILVVGSGLFLASYARLTAIELGFETDDRIVVETTLPSRDPRYYVPGAAGTYITQDAAVNFVYAVTESMARIPGVLSAAAGNYPPLPDHGWWRDVETPGAPPPDDGVDRSAVYRPVTAGWFETLGIPILQGRSYALEEASRGEDVAVIDERLAERWWPDGNAIGRTILLQEPVRTSRKPFRVVGVAGFVRQSTVRQGEIGTYDPNAVYFPPSSWPKTGPLPFDRRRLAFVVHTEVPLARIALLLKEVVWAHDPDRPVSVSSVEDVIGRPSSQLRFNTGLLLAFAGMALLLAATGVFAVMAYSVARRTRELGIRVALGAPAGRVERRELVRGMRLATIGIVTGTAGAAALTRVIEANLYGASPLDPRVYLSAGALLLVTAAAAAYLPARRAAGVDPIRALRTE